MFPARWLWARPVPAQQGPADTQIPASGSRQRCYSFSLSSALRRKPGGTWTHSGQGAPNVTSLEQSPPRRRAGVSGCTGPRCSPLEERCGWRLHLHLFTHSLAPRTQTRGAHGLLAFPRWWPVHLRPDPATLSSPTCSRTCCTAADGHDRLPALRPTAWGCLGCFLSVSCISPVSRSAKTYPRSDHISAAPIQAPFTAHLGLLFTDPSSPESWRTRHSSSHPPCSAHSTARLNRRHRARSHLRALALAVPPALDTVSHIFSCLIPSCNLGLSSCATSSERPFLPAPTCPLLTIPLPPTRYLPSMSS